MASFSKNRPQSDWLIVASVYSVRHLLETFFEQQILSLGPSPPFRKILVARLRQRDLCILQFLISIIGI